MDTHRVQRLPEDVKNLSEADYRLLRRAIAHRYADDLLPYRRRKEVVGVEAYAEGCVLHASRKVGNPTGKGGGKRGKVQTFSLASRRRLRQFLVTHEFPSDWTAFGVTYTVPGGPWPLEQYKDLWERYCKSKLVEGHALVWRAEVQKRGALHWHALYGHPPHTVYWPTQLPSLIAYDWLQHLDRVWPEVAYPRMVTVDWQPGTGAVRIKGGRMSGWPGAFAHACDVRMSEPGRGAWFAYLAQHASKFKEEQVGQDIGRHWGVVGRKRILRAEAQDMVMLTEAEYAKVRRIVERMKRRQVPSEASPFGKKLGRPLKLGRRGRSVVFGDPATILRLARWVQNEV